MKLHVFLFLIAAFSLANCGESTSNAIEIDQVQEETRRTEPDSAAAIVEVAETDSSKNEVDFLDIAFLEQLESSYGNSYEESVLRKKGFNMYYNEESEEGRSTLYKKSRLRNSMRLGRHLWKDGSHDFSVEYTVNEEQLKAFEADLSGTLYKRQKTGVYKKKGMGTYVEKTIKLNPSENTIVYWHYVGKEVSPIPPMPQPARPIPPIAEDL